MKEIIINEWILIQRLKRMMAKRVSTKNYGDYIKYTIVTIFITMRKS